MGVGKSWYAARAAGDFLQAIPEHESRGNRRITSKLMGVVVELRKYARLRRVQRFLLRFSESRFFLHFLNFWLFFQSCSKHPKNEFFEFLGPKTHFFQKWPCL